MEKNTVIVTLKNVSNGADIKDNLINFTCDEYDIKYHIEKEKIYITIISSNEVSDIYKHFMIHYQLLFFNNGYFYKIIEYKENEKVINISEKYNNTGMYDTCDCFINSYKITNINKLINSENIKKMDNLLDNYGFIFRAFYYLFSKRYEKVLIDHKFMILSQICEGYIESSEHEKKIEGEKNYSKRIKIYIDNFAKQDENQNSEIFQILGKDAEEIIDQITNTRHRYSHYVEKKNVIEDDMFWYYFVILELAFRMIILEDISIVLDNEMEENLFLIHDWIKDSLE